MAESFDRIAATSAPTILAPATTKVVTRSVVTNHTADGKASVAPASRDLSKALPRAITIGFHAVAQSCKEDAAAHGPAKRTAGASPSLTTAKADTPKGQGTSWHVTAPDEGMAKEAGKDATTYGRTRVATRKRTIAAHKEADEGSGIVQTTDAAPGETG